MLFLVASGAVAAPKGLNRRARIFEFVTVFNSQKSQTNTGLIRQPAIAPAHHQHPTEPSRDIPLKGTSEEPTERGCGAATATRGWVGAAVSAGSPALPRLGSCRPGKAEVQYLLFVFPAPARVGRGMRSHWRNVRNGVKRKKKKAARERIASKQLRAAAPLSCLLFYLNTPSFSRKKTLHNPARSAPRFAAGNGQRAAPTPPHPDPRSGERGANHPEKPPGPAGAGGTAGKTEPTSPAAPKTAQEAKKKKRNTQSPHARTEPSPHRREARRFPPLG